MKTPYLTQLNLKEIYLPKIFPGVEFIYNKSIPNTKVRPDFRSEELKLIIEFDGYRHYSTSSVILADYKKDELYQEMGYDIVRIPYFVQISSSSVRYYFQIDMDIKQEYPHGFINKKAMLPCDFCELGVVRLDDEIAYGFPKSIGREIIASLQDKVVRLGDWQKVLPPSLEYYLKLKTSNDY